MSAEFFLFGATLLGVAVWHRHNLFIEVARLPEASWHSALGLGFVSAVFDNIPLTALALSQGGYDWGVLAFAVGGSMIWFGSSAQVALATHFPQAKDTARWLREAWFVPVGFLLGFGVLLRLTGWHPVSL